MYPVIKIADGIFLPSYFLFISLGFVVAIFWIAKRSVEAKQSVSYAMDICLVTMVFGFLGSRLFHVFYEVPDYYLKYPHEIYKFWHGGFVFYGGVLGALLGVFIYSRIKKVKLLPYLNVISAPAALGYAIGRFATLLSGSGYGRPTDLPWGIIYPKGTEATAGVALHPTPIYAMLWELSLLGILLYVEKVKKPVKGVLFFMLMIGHGLGRLFVEQFRADFRGSDPVGLSISSWISLLVIVVGVFLLMKGVKSERSA